MTNKELAEWFGGIQEKSFRDTRAKKLKILEEYAEFENMRGKINITKIIKPIYIKKKNYYFIKEKTLEQWSDTGLDTCKLVANKISEKYYNNKEIKELEDSTKYTYVSKSKREFWGKAFTTEGKLGRCEYVMCKEIDGKCIEFTEEEKKIKQELLNKYYGNDVSEKLVFIRDMLDSKEITEEECWQELEKMTNMKNRYNNYRKELEKRIGAKVVRATRVETNAFKNIKKDDFKFQKGVKMYNNLYTKNDLIQAINNKDMSSLQRYSILAYYGFEPHEIQQVYHNLAISSSQEEQIKRDVENIVNTTINNILNKF